MPYENIILKDDPKALEKLEARLAECRKQLKHMNSVNRFYRKHGTCHGYPDMTDKTASMLDCQMGGRALQQTPYPLRVRTTKEAEIFGLEMRIFEFIAKEWRKNET